MSALFDWASGFSALPWVALLLIGYCLVVVEMYIPGFGLPGISGLLCLIVSVFFLSGGDLVRGLWLILGVAAALGVALFVCVRSASKGRLARSRLVLNETGAPLEPSALERYVGKTGSAASILRPAGVGLFHGERVNVLTQGEFIENGAPIIAKRVEGSALIVEKA